MSKAKWCKGEELKPQDAFAKALMGRHVYMNGRVVHAEFVNRWKFGIFLKHKWHRAIPLVHEKELIQRVLTYTKIENFKQSLININK